MMDLFTRQLPFYSSSSLDLRLDLQQGEWGKGTYRYKTGFDGSSGECLVPRHGL